MKRILLVANVEFTLTQFRREFIELLMDKGCEVYAAFSDTKWSFDQSVSLESLGVSCYNYSLERNGINPFKEYKTYKQLKSIVGEVHPDIVLNYTVKPSVYGSLGAHAAGVENVYSNVTGLGYVFTGKTLKRFILRGCLKFLYRIAFRYNKKVFFQNQDDMKLFINYRLVKAEQTCLINGSGINLAKFAPADCEVSGDEVSFLLISRLLKDKGVQEYVSAAEILKKKYDNVSFKLMGPLDDNPSSFLEKDLDAWRQHDVIDYLGSGIDVTPHILAASVYVFPSYREGTPRSVLEAMAMAKPIVTTDVPGCRETVEAGRNGFLVPARDARALAAAMEEFVLKPEIIATMGSCSREIAEKRYDVYKVNDKITSVLGLS